MGGEEYLRTLRASAYTPSATEMSPHPISYRTVNRTPSDLDAFPAIRNFFNALDLGLRGVMEVGRTFFVWIVVLAVVARRGIFLGDHCTNQTNPARPWLMTKKIRVAGSGGGPDDDDNRARAAAPPTMTAGSDIFAELKPPAQR